LNLDFNGSVYSKTNVNVLIIVGVNSRSGKYFSKNRINLAKKNWSSFKSFIRI